MHSVLKAAVNIETEIFVVDNNSTDGSKEYLVSKFNDVKFIWLPENVGFSKANNIALKEATGVYVLFLNPDTIVPENCFSSCIQFLKENNNNGALGIKMIDGSGHFLKESKRGFPSLTASFFKLSGLTALFPDSKFFAAYYMAHLPQNKNAEVEVLAGAFMMIPKTILDKVGSFDEQFFMYGEDVDLSYRIKKAGFSNYYFADSTIIHFKGESTKKQDAKYINTFYDAMKLFVAKHYSKFNSTVFSFLIWAIASFKKKFLLFFGKKDKTKASKKSVSLLIGESSKIKTNYKSSNLTEIISLINQHNITEIIFCEGTITYAEIIKSIQTIHFPIIFKFSSGLSNSIISSNDKDLKGLALEL